MAQEDGTKIGAFQRFDNFMRAIANGATFGMADVVAGIGNSAIEWTKNKWNGESSDVSVKEQILKEINLTADAQEKTPAESATGTMLGMLLTNRSFRRALLPRSKYNPPIDAAGQEHGIASAGLTIFIEGSVKPIIAGKLNPDGSEPFTPPPLPRLNNSSKEDGLTK